MLEHGTPSLFDQEQDGVSVPEAPTQPTEKSLLPSIAERSGGYGKPDHGRSAPDVWTETAGHIPPGGHVEMNPDALATQEVLERRKGDGNPEAMAKLQAVRDGSFDAGEDPFPLKGVPVAEPKPLVNGALEAADAAWEALDEAQIDTAESVEERSLPINEAEREAARYELARIPRRVDTNGSQPGDFTTEKPYSPSPIIRRSDRQPTGTPADAAFQALGDKPADTPIPTPPVEAKVPPNYYAGRARQAIQEGLHPEEF